MDLPLDACPIKALLEVVECAVSYEVTIQGVIPSLMWPVKFVQCIECRGNDYFTWIFPFFLYLHVSTVFLGILSFGTSGLLNASRGRLAHRAPREVDLFVFPSWILICVLG